MDELITTTEKSSLQRLIALSTQPEMTFSYSEMQGYLFGIAITPEKISPREWLPVMFGNEVVAYESKEQQRWLLTTLFNVLNKHIAAFQADALFLPFDMANLGEGELEKVLQWASGFEEALALCPECWEESPDLSEEEHEELLNSLLVVEGIVYPEDAADIFEYVPYEELVKMGVDLADEQISKTSQIQYLMLQAFDLAVDTIVSHAAVQDEKRKRKKSCATTPFEIHAGKAGKNVGCPCGKDRKFKDCCGAPSSEVMTQQQYGSRKNVIEVDFRQHGRKSGATSRVSQGRGAVGYQLEIVLAYTDPLIWRRIEVPGTISLAMLHEVVQLVMGWHNRHMHHFQGGLTLYGPQVADDYGDDAMRDESRFTLQDLESELLQGMVYRYDMGDNWEHTITLEKVVPAGEARSFPYVINGDRACPPEDIGGPPLFADFLRYLAEDRKATEQDEFSHFSVEQLKGYDPVHFDRQRCNEKLKSMYNER